MAAAAATALGGVGLIFSGFVSPCLYLMEHRGELALNYFPEYPGAESLRDIQEATHRFECYGPDLTWPMFRGGMLARPYEERRARYRIGTGDCKAGLRAPPRWTIEGSRTDELIDNFKFLIEHLQDAGVQPTGMFVNLGASDGIDSDPLAIYSQLPSVGGIAVEADKRRCEAYRRNFPHVHLLCMRLTPATVPRVARLVAQYAGGPYDVLKVDIDSYDCDVVGLFLGRFGHRPYTVLMEVNAAFPPPVEFSMGYLNSSTWLPVRIRPTQRKRAYDDEFAVAYGCSLSHAVRLLAGMGYVLLQVVRKDALFLRGDVAERLLGTRERPDEFECYASNILEIRGINAAMVRRWSYGQELDVVLEEMRSVTRADLRNRLGDVAGTRAQFKLEVSTAPVVFDPENG